MNCGKIQTGRIDPIINPSGISSHAHNIVGAYNFGLNSTYDDLQSSKCTSCEIAADKSAYWTPQLYYSHTNGSFEKVPNGGAIVYYLGRGDDLANIQPFPPGFAMLSGSNTARSFDNTTKTWNGARNIADRVSFVCLDNNYKYEQTPGLVNTHCSNGMRAQIHFQSCWDGVNLYKQDNSHVAYMSGIDNGKCHTSHPVQLVHLFYEIYYSVNTIDQTDGGRFVFSNGDTTGYGFHGDFLNGWDTTVLGPALQQCATSDNGSGQIQDCPVLAAVNSASYARNCPERPPLLHEPVKGMLLKLPGCNTITSGPQPATSDQVNSPIVNSATEGWQYLGSADDGTSNRALAGANWADDSMTVGKCQQFCSSKNFQYAGVEYGRECYCDSHLNTNATLSGTYSTKYNTMTCAGNGTQYCGGPSRLLLYKNADSTPPFPTVVGDTLNAAKYLGCASEVDGRALPAKRVTSSNMTISSCAASCSSYALSGLEYSSESAGSTLGQNSCKMTCTGDKTKICGGSGALTLFKNTAYRTSTTTIPTQTQTTSIPASMPTSTARGPTVPGVSKARDFTYIGCANENNANPGRALPGASYSNTTVTNDQCSSFCAAQNFKYSGTEYGKECYCGNDLETGSAADKTGCTSKCAGNLAPDSPFAQHANTCGGSSLLSIWRNEKYKPVQVVPSAGNYVSQGCYNEASTGRALSGASLLNASMTVEVCVGYCSSKGYGFAGVEYAQECYCSNTLATSATPATDQSSCNMICKGNKLECNPSSRIRRST
ncbi:WSC-domain-containing protein [Tothia fuscella]|uniref:WSC-domain-containing protein n=1 Tax=Tothia fuscella TaxID=1048955 RepID=A0A9P4TWC2_9PEZI|nr:WSC-domain-containing protein [Tothia fuscella]